MKLFEKSLCRMTSVVVLFSYPVKLNISTSKTVTKLYERSYRVILNDLHNAIDKLWEKISLHKQSA